MNAICLLIAGVVHSSLTGQAFTLLDSEGHTAYGVHVAIRLRQIGNLDDRHEVRLF